MQLDLTMELQRNERLRQLLEETSNDLEEARRETEKWRVRYGKAVTEVDALEGTVQEKERLLRFLREGAAVGGVGGVLEEEGEGVDWLEEARLHELRREEEEEVGDVGEGEEGEGPVEMGPSTPEEVRVESRPRDGRFHEELSAQSGRGCRCSCHKVCVRPRIILADPVVQEVVARKKGKKRRSKVKRFWPVVVVRVIGVGVRKVFGRRRPERRKGTRST